MSRWVIAVGLAVGVTLAGSTGAGADTLHKPAAGSAKKSVRKSTVKPIRKASRARRKAAGKVAATNMPRGFTWPPSQAMAQAGAACERALSAAEVAWKPTAREGHITDAVTIEDGMLGGIAYRPVFGKGPYKLDCQLALALHAIGPELYAAGVREVRFGSIYRWSNVRVGGKTKNVLSRHALGLAMDVVSFVDDDGREAKVARDYQAGDPLLLEVEQTIDASSSFRLVLTPKNDPISHKDHFHIEANPSYAKPVPRS
jgi:hypothetical protein